MAETEIRSFPALNGAGGLLSFAGLQSGRMYITAGLDTPADGKGAIYYYDRLATDSADGVSILDPPRAKGRLRRLAMLGYQGATNIVTTQVALNASTATLIAAARASRRRLIVQNLSGSVISYLGEDDTVSSADGLRLAVNAEEILETTAAVYAISASATPSLAVCEEYD